MQRDQKIKICPALARSPLFSGISTERLPDLLDCLHARLAEYGKGQMVLWQGEAVSEVGVVCSGRARSLKADREGKNVIVTLLGPGDYVGVLLAASRERKSPVSVQAGEPLKVLFLPFASLTARCGRLCPEHDRLLQNVLDGIAEKALVLHDRNDCLARPTIREKVLVYLDRLAREQGTRSPVSPLDRQSMADYLGTERSALSRELSCMRREGLLDFAKNCFTLKY